ncbi:MAG: methyltransferase domain-containing protein [Candidatus Woesearchaeota archaeon]
MKADLYDRQREYFFSFLARTDQKDNTIQHLKEKIGTYTPETMKAISEGKRVRFFDIGPATGRVTIPFVDSLRSDVELVIEEPSLGMAVSFFLNYLTYALPYENFHLKHDGKLAFNQEKNDFVLSSHSMYYLPDWKKAVSDLYGSLVPGGALCIIVSSDDSNLTAIRKKYFPKIHSSSAYSNTDLERILGNLSLDYDSFDICSRIDFADQIPNPATHLRKEGIYKPSVDSLWSFLLWTDYSGLSDELKKHLNSFVKDRLDQDRWLQIKDTAYWIRKPGSSEHQFASSQANRKMTLEDVLKVFRPQLEKYFGPDVALMSNGLKEAYYTVLAFDCVLTHPLTKVTIMEEYNSTIDDNEGYPSPLEGKQMRDFVVFDPCLRMTKLSEWPTYLDQHYLFWHGKSFDTTLYLLDHIAQEFQFLKEEDKVGLNGKEFLRFILNLVDKHLPGRVFSNRYDGSTHLTDFLHSPMLSQTALRVPETLTPELISLYDGAGLTLPEPSPREAQNIF